MLSIPQKSAVRMHLGYPVAGLYQTSPAGGTLASGAIGYRWTQAYGFLEYKLINLNPDEEARITGNAVGDVAIVGPVSVGDTYTVTISGGGLSSPVALTLTAESADVQQPNPALVLVKKLAALGSANTTLNQAGFFALAPYGTGPFSENAYPYPEMGFQAPNAFTLTVGNGVGNTSAAVTTTTGTPLSPYAYLGETNPDTKVYGFLPILDWLMGETAGATRDLSITKAGPFFARPDEVRERIRLYNYWRYLLARDLDQELWDARASRGSGSMVLT